ncbi:hypothetical protein O1Q79_00413 [Lonepinella sp. MS14434]|uniref:hypothetical protein n=1 Tax=Lonepinella sp. MS14434 TaxID=3003617 RepID=UPI0036D84D04
MRNSFELIDTLEIRINTLFQPLSLIHLLTKIDYSCSIDPSELADSLTGVGDLIQRSINDLNNYVDLLRKAVNEAEIANNPPPTDKTVKQPHAGPSKRLQGEQ